MKMDSIAKKKWLSNLNNLSEEEEKEEEDGEELDGEKKL